VRGKRLDIDGSLRIPPRPDYTKIPANPERERIEKRKTEGERRRYGTSNLGNAQRLDWHYSHKELQNARSRKWNDENRELHRALNKEDYYRRKEEREHGGTRA